MTLVLGEFAREIFVKIEWRRTLDGRTTGPEGPLGFSGIEYYYANQIQPVAQALISTCVAVLCLAVIWLYWGDNSAWATFLLVWTIVVTSLDNFLRGQPDKL